MVNTPEAFLNYGRYAETYFSGETGNPKDYGADDEQRILSEMSVPSSVPDEEDYIGSSLLLEESTVLRHYYSNNAQGRTKKAITTSEGTRDAYYIEKKFVYKIEKNDLSEISIDGLYRYIKYYMKKQEDSLFNEVKWIKQSDFEKLVLCQDLAQNKMRSSAS